MTIIRIETRSMTSSVSNIFDSNEFPGKGSKELRSVDKFSTYFLNTSIVWFISGPLVQTTFGAPTRNKRGDGPTVENTTWTVK